MTLAKLGRQAKRPHGFCVKMTAVAILGLCFIFVWSMFSFPVSSVTSQRRSFGDIAEPTSADEKLCSSFVEPKPKAEPEKHESSKKEKKVELESGSEKKRFDRSASSSGVSEHKSPEKMEMQNQDGKGKLPDGVAADRQEGSEDNVREGKWRWRRGRGSNNRSDDDRAMLDSEGEGSEVIQKESERIQFVDQENVDKVDDGNERLKRKEKKKKILGPLFDPKAHYIWKLCSMVPDIEWGKNIRVVLDLGCRDASFGNSLIDKEVLTFSLGLKDDLADLAQVVLERGFPSVVSPFATRRLPFPSGVFDAIHCGGCSIPWHSNRMTSLTASICWNILAHKTDEDSGVDVRICQKPDSNDIYELRRKKFPPMCKENENADAACYVPINTCLHPIPSSIEERGAEWPGQWPNRLETFPDWMNEKERLVADTEHRKAIVDKSYITGIGIDWSKIRNVMDMKAIYGGFCGCKQPVAIIVEMDRILRPGGWVIPQDKVEILDPIEGILRSMHWEIRMTYNQDEEGILCAQKSHCRP
ncbi:putative S-adenosyl-L-methionine-dependent methyltransferase [Dillenia turbinata]|uniref:Methyltransferase n=1 Tax=Dillenia turbinata TaxID=194707 RepID=A0AAN8ZLW7_9MAGN